VLRPPRTRRPLLPPAAALALRRPLGPRHPVGRWGRTFLLGIGVGAVAGLAAAALDAGIHTGTELLVGRVADLGGAGFWQPRWAVLWLPAAGGLFSGLVVAALAPRSEGHGTDQLVVAFHRRDGELALRAPAVKAGASVGVISCGGSAGPEGPMAALGAALGSATGRLAGLTPRDRRVLLLSGCAAAVGAVFGCPLGGALFACSVLYREPEFEGSALVSSFIASAVGYSTYVGFWGADNRVLVHTGALHFESGAELPVYAVLGALCGGTAIFYASAFRGTEGLFRRARRVPVWLRPALGGLLTGLVACALPQVMDGRYRTVQSAFDGLLFADAGGPTLALAGLLAAVALAKCAATAFTVGSGASGGLLGPSVFIGGVVGAALGTFLQALWPGAVPDELRQALVPVGMAGVLSAAMRTPLAAMVIVMEMTGSFGLIVPLMLVTMTAYVIGRRFGLVDAQVQTSADSPAHAGDALVHRLEQVRVRELMQTDWPARARRDTRLDELLASAGEAPSATVPVVEGGRLVGLVSLAELRHLLDEEALPSVVIAADLMTSRPVVLDPDDDLYAAVSAFERWGAEVLPVVQRDGEAAHWVGMLTRRAVHALVQEYLETMRANLLKEHAGLAALEEQSQLTHLMAALAPHEAGSLERVPVDGELQGRSLAELDFRRRRGREVLAVRTSGGRLLCPPDPQRALEKGDLLVVLAPAAGSGRAS